MVKLRFCPFKIIVLISLCYFEPRFDDLQYILTARNFVENLKDTLNVLRFGITTIFVEGFFEDFLQVDHL